MKKGNKTFDISILLFLLGILLFFLVLGSLKEGVKNSSTCPNGYYISKNNKSICCQGKKGWYVSSNDWNKCCNSKGYSIKNKKCNNGSLFTKHMPVISKPIIR